jgi:diguanylate cyclase (GGDEF)-like protein/PAS domain S-box-containing protein
LAKSFHLLYQNEEQFQIFIEENELSQYPVLLVQAFVCQMNEREIESLKSLLQCYLPQAVIVGCNSAGEIINGTISNNQPVLTFTTFEKTNIGSGFYHIDGKVDFFNLGEEIAEEMVTSETKVMMMFVSHSESDINELLAGYHAKNPDVIVVGCTLSDKILDHPSYVFTESRISQSGIAVISFDNHDLIVETMVNEEWEEVGHPLTATKSKGNILYEINGKKPIHILRHYLGTSFVSRLPKSGAEIPFLITRNGDRSAVFIKNVLDGGALELSKSIFEGEQFSFAFTNIESLVSTSQKDFKKLKKRPIETIFAFNCVPRKGGLDHLTKYSIESLNQIAPVSGLFCYGEIGNKNKKLPEVFSQSLIYLTLSESNHVNESFEENTYTMPTESHTMVTLTNLINASAKDINLLNDHIKISDAHNQALFENNMDIVYSADLKGNFISVNSSFEKAIGYSSEELKGKSSVKLVLDTDIPKAKRHFRKTLDGKIQFYNVDIKTKSRKIKLFHIKNIPIIVNGECVGVYGIGRDISESIKFEEKITQLSNYDEGTGLPNRSKFNEIIVEMLMRAKKKRRSLAVLFLDIDRFKIINDTLGHYAGDLMLKELANRLKNALSNGAYIGRFTSDKFSILLTKEFDPESVIHICKQLLKVIEMPFTFQKQEFYLTASIGISMYPYDGDEGAQLLKNADIALSRSKIQGGNGIVFFSDEMNKDTLNRVELESHLRRAMKNNELYLTYQPIIESSRHVMSSCEALIRWNHPERGIISPLEFIPLAEETGLIQSIGKWVLKTACKQMKEWHNEGLTDASISINVSASQFQNRWFIEDVKNALAYSDLDPKYLHLELTETVMLNDSIKTIDTMHALRNIGVKISIDDFGTGYSSLSYLRHLPIHILKIDKSFIQNLDVQTPDFAIVKSIMTMGQGLGLQVTAEGVETNKQFEILKEMNCNFIQGYLIEKPILPTQMKEWIQNFSLINLK